MSVPFIMGSFLLFIGLMLTGWMVSSYDPEYPVDGLILIGIFPTISFIGSALWFRAWYEFDWKTEPTKPILKPKTKLISNDIKPEFILYKHAI